MENEATVGNETTTTPRQTRNVPFSDADLGKLCSDVSTKWSNNAWLTLLWMTSAQFTANTGQFNSLMELKGTQAAGRPELTQELELLDKQIDQSLAYVKSYLLNKFGKGKDVAHYAAFGIQKIRGSYRMAADRNARMLSLKLMLEGLAKEGFANEVHGAAFWMDIHDRYTAGLAAATNTDSGVSKKAGDKNELKISLRKTLTALVGLLKINYPETWKAELRDWGFQKEKY